MNDKYNDKNELINLIKQNNVSRCDIPKNSSAVLIPIIKKDDEYHILFEVRSSKLSFQPGEVCFAGGKIEDGEAPKDCAVRECMEELFPGDKSSDHIEIICSLAPMFGPAGNIVYPFAGFLHDYNYSFSTDEVKKVFSYPISFFEEHPPVIYPMEKRTFAPENFPHRLVSGSDKYQFHVQHYNMCVYEDTSPVIWGFTGRLLNEFMALLK